MIPVLLATVALIAAPEPAMVIPINAGEAIIEPFYDADISGFREWKIEPGHGHGLEVSQSWSAVNFGSVPVVVKT